MEHHRLLTTLALVNSRFFGTTISEDAQSLFSEVYNGRTPLGLDYAARVFLSFYNTPAWEAVEGDLVSTLEDLTKAPEVLSEQDISNIKLLSKNILQRFDWADSPEGWKFWDGVMNNLGKVLGKMDWAHDVETPVEPEAHLPGLLGRSFLWAETEQGYEYWRGVSEALSDQHHRTQPSTQYDDGSEDPDWLGDPEPEDTLTENERAELLELAHRIDADILWSDSPMGNLYWSEVFENLLRLAGESGDAYEHHGAIPHTGENTDEEYSYTKQDTLDINMTWADTPQGHEYWSGVQEALVEEAELSAARTTVETPVEFSEGGCMDEPVPDIDPDAQELRLIKVLSKGIVNRIIWSKTPQGFDYWEDVMRNLRSLTGDDKKWGWAHDPETPTPGGKLNELLGEAFIWSDTPQGGKYWHNVEMALYNLQESGLVEGYEA